MRLCPHKFPLGTLTYLSIFAVISTLHPADSKCSIPFISCHQFELEVMKNTRNVSRARSSFKLIQNWNTSRNCFVLVLVREKWSSANHTCSVAGGRLAWITDYHLAKQLMTFVTEIKNLTAVWIGLKLVKGDWSWHCPSNFNRSIALTDNMFWASGHPKDPSNCTAAVLTQQGLYCQNATYLHYFICEHEYVTVRQVRKTRKRSGIQMNLEKSTTLSNESVVVFEQTPTTDQTSLTIGMIAIVVLACCMMTTIGISLSTDGKRKRKAKRRRNKRHKHSNSSQAQLDQGFGKDACTPDISPTINSLKCNKTPIAYEAEASSNKVQEDVPLENTVPLENSVPFENASVSVETPPNPEHVPIVTLDINSSTTTTSDAKENEPKEDGFGKIS